MKFQTLVVDDETPARNELIYMLNNTDFFSTIHESSDGNDAIEKVINNNYDVVFLDIEMPGKNGLEVAAELINFNRTPQIVFVTAYDKYAIDAFDINAVDYLLKPFSQERLNETIERIITQGINTNKLIKDQLEKVLFSIANDKIKKIPANSKNGRIKLVSPEDIYFAFTRDHNVFIKTGEGTFKIDYTLKELVMKIANSNFFRCHRSYVVNLDKVKEIIPWFKGNYRLILSTKNDTEVPVGRTKIDELKNRLNL